MGTFKPIIQKKHKTSLDEKKVEIAGNTDFSRDTKIPVQKLNENVEKETEVSSKKSKDNSPTIEVLKENYDVRFKANLTQKISPAVNLKLNTLKPFLGDLENMHKTTINEIVNLLADSYVQTRFSTRQQDAFKSMYNTQFDMLKK